MTNALLSIDPGLSSGAAVLSWDDNEPPRLEEAWQFTGGLAGFDRWWDDLRPIRALDGNLRIELSGKRAVTVTVVCEKFQPISHSNYALTTASVEPLRIEGYLFAEGAMPDYDKTEKRWRRPADQYIFGGKTLPEKKKAQHRWLKENGFYVTGSMLGAPDADDCRSAIAHGLSYLVKEVKHRPTFELVTGGKDAG